MYAHMSMYAQHLNVYKLNIVMIRWSIAFCTGMKNWFEKN